MSETPPRTFLPAPVARLFGDVRFASALATAIVTTAFSSWGIRAVLGWPGLLGILTVLCLLAAVSFVAYRGMIEWHGLLPVSLLIFVGWCAVSIVWSNYQWATLAAICYQLVFAFLAVYVALVRDTIQVVRLVGNVLRTLLGVSLALEALSGLVLDVPIAALGIHGRIAYGGPIQGVFGSRNQLGLVAVLALVTFLVEWRTHSVRRRVAVSSVALAAVCLLLSRSPVVLVVLVVVLLATLALFGLRHIRGAERRFAAQVGLAAFAVAAAVVGYTFRWMIVGLLGAGGVLKVRYDVWVHLWGLIRLEPAQGWGWIGFWRDLPPFSFVDAATGGWHDNALNAYFDVALQVGFLGLLLFLVLAVLAFGRSWLIASNKRSVIHVWSPLVLVALLATSVVESSILIEFGWLLLVVCTVKASQNMSWRTALPGRAPG